MDVKLIKFVAPGTTWQMPKSRSSRHMRIKSPNESHPTPSSWNWGAG